MTAERLPKSVDAERSLLGGMLVQPARIPELEACVEPVDFFRLEHARLFAYLVDRYRRDEPMDQVSVLEAIGRSGEASAYGGISYVMDLPDYTPSTANLTHYAEVIAQHSALRAFLEHADEWRARAFDGADPAELFDAVTAQLQSFARPGRGAGEWIGDALDRHIDRAERIHADGIRPGIPTGYRDLDAKLGGGPVPGNLVVLAARPAMGKTALALNILLRTAKAGQCVGLFSMEMGTVELLDRMISAYTGIRLDIIRDPSSWTQLDWDQIMGARDEIARLPILIDTRVGLKVSQIRSEAMRWRVQHQVSMIAVDYLGLIPTPLGQKVEATGANARDLKLLAKTLGIPVLLIHQLNRGVEGRADKTPMMSDLKDSGEIEQHADVVLFVYRPSYYNPAEARRLAWLIVAKNRQGQTGKVETEWYGEVQLFRDAPTVEERRRAGKKSGGQEEEDRKKAAANDRESQVDKWRQTMLPGTSRESG